MSEALERLRNRNRPTVPTRDASLVSVPAIPPSTISFDIPTKCSAPLTRTRYPDSEISIAPEAKPQDSTSSDSCGSPDVSKGRRAPG
jgi:hypothetical protein